MANELGLNTKWTFYKEAPIPEWMPSIMVSGEVPELAYTTGRDVAVFTNMRLIVRDAQGISGKKVEQYSLPWKSVIMWSSENAIGFDFDSEIELWTLCGHVKINLAPSASVRNLDSVISAYILGSNR